MQLFDFKQYNKLGEAVDKALHKALQVPSKTEPQLIANLVWHLPNEINNLSFSHDFSVEIGGVFVHAQPFVKCNNFPKEKPKSVEIGDLLLLRTGVQGRTVVDCRALLLQAKKISSIPTSPDNENQHHLYEKWPPFVYSRSTRALNGEQRHVKGADLYNATKYLLIGQNQEACHKFPDCRHNSHFPHNHMHECYALTAQPSQPLLTQYYCFFQEILDFIFGHAGKVYKEPHWNDKNWNRVIEDLTTITAERLSVYMKRASSGVASERGQEVSFFCSGNFTEEGMLSRAGISLNEVDGNREGPPVVPNDRLEGDETGGISVIEFVVNSSVEEYL